MIKISIISFIGILIIMAPFSLYASWGYPHGVKNNARQIFYAMSHKDKVISSEIRTITEHYGKPSWTWKEWMLHSDRSIALRENQWITWIVPVISVLFIFLAFIIKRWRTKISCFILAGIVLFVVNFWLAASILSWLPPYKSFDYIDDFEIVANTSFPGDSKIILFYEKLDLRPNRSRKLVFFCDGSIDWFTKEELTSAIKNQDEERINTKIN